MFHPQIGVENGFSNPQWGYIMAEAGLFSSLRLAQIVEQASSTVTVAVDASQTDLGTVSGGGGFACGEECTVVATANDGYVFRYWLDGDEVTSVDAEYTFVVAGNRNLTAVFADVVEVCNVEFDLVSDPNYEGMFGWGGEAIQLSFDDGTPSIALTMPVPEMDWNALIIANMAGQNVSLDDFDFPQSQTFTLPINKGTSVELSWLMPSSTMTTLQFSHTFSASYETGEPIIENAGSSNLPFTFQCDREDITIAVDPEEGGYIITEGTLNIGETVTLTAVANEHFTFVNWTFNGIEVSTDPTYSFMVTEEGDMVAHFELLYDISISVSSSPEEGGTVSGGGMYGYGTTCTVTAIPNEGYSFMYWTEQGNVVSTNANYSFVISQDRDLVAHFTLPFSITITSNLATGGAISGAGEYDYGSTCTLTATPNDGYLFLNWSINGEVVAVNATYSFAVTEDMELEAVFMQLNGYMVGEGEATSNKIPTNSSSFYSTYSMTQQIYLSEELGGWRRISTISFYNAGEADTRTLDVYLAHTDSDSFGDFTMSVSEEDRVFSGDVTFARGYWTTISLTKSFLYNGNSNLLLVVYDHTGSIPAGMSFRVYEAQGNQSLSEIGDYSPLGSYSPYSSLSVKNQIILNQSRYYNIYASCCYWAGSFSASGHSGYSGSGHYYYSLGATCTLTAIPSEGFSFLYWSENGEQVSTNPVYSFTVASNRNLEAHFSPFNITATADPEEGGTVIGAGEYDCQSSCTLTAIADEGYTFMNWTCDGGVVSTEPIYSFSVNRNAEYVAHFALPFSVSVTIDPSESGSVLGEGEYDYGTTCTLSAIPNDGYVFLKWTDSSGNVVSNEPTYSFTVTEDVHFTAIFEALPNGVYVGTGGAATSRSLPSRVQSNYSISQQIYTQSEIGDAMEIVNLSFYNEGDENVRYYEIYMVHTDMTSIDPTAIDSTNTGWVNVTRNDRVFRGVVTMRSGCWNTIILGRPFAYDGVSNLAIIVNDITGEEHWFGNMSCRVYNSDGIQAIIEYGSSSYNPLDPPISWRCDGDKNQIILNREPEVAITATAEPEQGGTIVGAGDYIQGTECTLYALPNDNYTFLYWTENEEEVSSDANYSFTVTTDRNLVAHFALNNQTISLNSGWTWLSTYVEQEDIDGLGMLEEGLNPNGVMIKSQRDGFLSYANGMWMGTLEAITNEKMYLVNTSDSNEVTFTGPVAQLNSHPITLNPNWTWLGYSVPFAVDINEALANLNASEGDVLKSQSIFATYSEEDGWYGSLNQLTPGMGLMYQSHNSQPVTFSYGVGVSRALKANLTAENNHWVPDIHAYPNNMNIMAVVELNGVELQDERYELAIFDGNECRGSVRLVYVPAMHRYVAFLTVAGEEDAKLCLALYDTMTGEAYYNTTDCLSFEANAVLGSLSMPYVARFGGTAELDELGDPTVELYPNPVSAGHRFQMALPAESKGAQVSIVDALGVVISTTDIYDKPATMRAPAVPGVYTVRIVTAKQETHCRKLIVK